MASFIQKIYRTKNVTETVKVFIRDYLAIPKSYCYKTEADVERVIAKQMIEEFGSENVKRQYAVGGFLNLKCDIDLYDGQCGIELKLAKQLSSATNLQRVLGQVYYYSQRRYKDTGLILLIVGTKEELDPNLKELKSYVEKIEGVHFVYKVADKK